MGIGSSSKAGTLAKEDPIVFKNSKPAFKYDTIVKCFPEQGNGLLFRMVNEKKKQWAYYNDTTEYEMHVKVTFGPLSAIKALGKTRIVQTEDSSWEATVVVYPGETDLFIEGDEDGFEADTKALPLSDEYFARQAEREEAKKKKK